jgi:nicotinate phosphoribosyltransferase
MWLLKDTPALLMDLYELTMAQVYFKKNITGTAHFEVFIRSLPHNWGFFVMAGLEELNSYLESFTFSPQDLEFLKSTNKFSNDFLEFLRNLKPSVKIRTLPEGTIFFPLEPAFEVTGPLIDAQILESYTLNILGFSIIETSLAARYSIAAAGKPLVDFGLRRAQGPLASVRAAAAAKIAGFAATSNLFASKLLDLAPTGTMAHSFIKVYGSEEQAFCDFAETYGPDAILLVDTYDITEGIKKAASVARQFLDQKGVKIRGIRLDSGDLAESSKFAREYFKQNKVEFLKIFASGDLDEFKIEKLIQQGAQIDGFGVGTNFSVSRYAPALDIIYKLVQYEEKKVFKKSPDKQTLPGRKKLLRVKNRFFEKDIVCPIEAEGNDLLQPFTAPETVDAIKERLASQLNCLKPPLKKIQDPDTYPVQFNF